MMLIILCFSIISSFRLYGSASANELQPGAPHEAILEPGAPERSITVGSRAENGNIDRLLFSQQLINGSTFLRTNSEHAEGNEIIIDSRLLPSLSLHDLHDLLGTISIINGEDQKIAAAIKFIKAMPVERITDTRSLQYAWVHLSRVIGLIQAAHYLGIPSFEIACATILADVVLNTGGSFLAQARIGNRQHALELQKFTDQLSTLPNDIQVKISSRLTSWTTFLNKCSNTLTSSNIASFEWSNDGSLLYFRQPSESGAGSTLSGWNRVDRHVSKVPASRAVAEQDIVDVLEALSPNGRYRARINKADYALDLFDVRANTRFESLSYYSASEKGRYIGRTMLLWSSDSQILAIGGGNGLIVFDIGLIERLKTAFSSLTVQQALIIHKMSTDAWSPVAPQLASLPEIIRTVINRG